MSISFERNRAQTLFEQFLGVNSSEELSGEKERFKTYIISASEASELKDALNLDAIDFFYNGVLSFAEGINSIFQRHFSWSTVKLYYAIYYLLRASLASKGIAMLRCHSMYRLKAIEGEKPFSTNNKAYNTTHEGTIKHYKDLFSASDKLLSNNIDDIDAYEWMMSAREIVNYRSKSFKEPECLDIWNEFSLCLDDASLPKLLKQLEDDPYVLCFQEEFAVVAIPIKRMKETIVDMHNNGLLDKISQERGCFAKDAIGYKTHSLSILNEIFGE